MPVAGNQVYVQFDHFGLEKYEAVDWFLLTIYAPNGFHDWEVSSKDMKQMLQGKKDWRITASKSSIQSENVLEMLANIKEKMGVILGPDSFLGTDLFPVPPGEGEEGEE